MKKDICIVGIAGGSASGKTTIVNNIKELSKWYWTNKSWQLLSIKWWQNYGRKS